MFTPLIIFLGLVSSNFSIFLGSKLIAANFLTIGVTTSIFSRIRKTDWSIFIGYMALINNFFGNQFSNHQNIDLVSISIFLPAIIYGLINELEKQDLSLKITNLLATSVFGITSIIASIHSNRATTLALISAIAIYTVYKFIRSQKESLVMLNFVVVLSWIWALVNLFKINDVGGGYYFKCLRNNFGYTVVESNFKFILAKISGFKDTRYYLFTSSCLFDKCSTGSRNQK